MFMQTSTFSVAACKKALGSSKKSDGIPGAKLHTWMVCDKKLQGRTHGKKNIEYTVSKYVSKVEREHIREILQSQPRESSGQISCNGRSGLLRRSRKTWHHQIAKSAKLCFPLESGRIC